MVKDWPFKPDLCMPNHLSQRDEPLRWRYTPSENRNSLGLRNREVFPKENGTYRILFLGDSLLWHGETSSGELYTEVLEHRLNTHFSNRPIRYEVINAGIPGYTTYQELEFLKIYGLDMDPDLVILCFVLNDLYYKYLHRPTNKHFMGWDPTARFNYFDTNSFPGVVFARSHLAHEVVRRSRILWKQILRKPIFRFDIRESHLAWRDYGWIRTKALIREMQKLLTERGISLRVVVFPVKDQVNDQYLDINRQYVLYPQSQIRKICDHNEIQILDLTNPLYLNGGTTLFKDYFHLTEKGNDIVADELERDLVDEI